MDWLDALLSSYKKNLIIPIKTIGVLHRFFSSYAHVAKRHGYSEETIKTSLNQLLRLIEIQFTNPYTFPPFHKHIRSPIDYYQFGIDFMLPLIDMENSSVSGLDNLEKISQAILAKENVILFANHQIEGDPQVFSILLKDKYPLLAEEKIFVAGERVLTDPLATPFSMGCNLLCIYSKKYIDNPPEEQHKKQLHNKKTMDLMSSLLKDGGKCIYVAPSGGRDRRGLSGKVEVAPFDPQSIEMFHLMAKRAKTPTHFYPLALATYSVLPPPEKVQVELGEERTTHGGAVHLHFCDPIDLDHISAQGSSKHELRKIKSDLVFNAVNQAYQSFNISY